MNKETDNPQNRVEITNHSNGMVISKIPYMNDKKHGLEIWWYEDGTKWTEAMWKAGKMHGLERWWHEDGTKSYERMWRDDKHHGIRTQWYVSGLKWEEQWFVNYDSYAWVEWDQDKSIRRYFLPTPTITTTNLNPTLSPPPQNKLK